MKRYAPILAILVIVLFVSDGWAPPPAGGGGSGIPIRKVQDLLDVTKPLSPANGEGLLYGTDANKFFATDIQTQVEADAQVSSDAAAYYDSSESAKFTGLTITAATPSFVFADTTVNQDDWELRVYGGIQARVYSSDSTWKAMIEFSNFDGRSYLRLYENTAGADDWRITPSADSLMFQQYVDDTTWTNKFYLDSDGDPHISDDNPAIRFLDTDDGHDDWKIGVDADRFRLEQFIDDSAWVERFALQNTGKFQYSDTTGTVVFSMDVSGNITTVGNITSQGAVSVASTLTLTGALDANGTADFATTVVFNGLVGFGRTTGQVANVDVYDTGTAIQLGASTISHGATNILPADVYAKMTKINNNGGFSFTGVSENSANSALVFYGVIGAGSSTIPAVEIRTAEIQGVGGGLVDAGELAFSVTNVSSHYFDIMGDGKVGINDTSPDAQLDIQSGAAGNIGIIVQGAAGQTADMINILASAGTVLFEMDADGSITGGTYNGATIVPPSYGAIYATDMSLTITTTDLHYLASGGTGSGVGEWVQEAVNGVSYNGTTGSFEIDASSAGVYEMEWAMTVEGGNNSMYDCHISVEGSDINMGHAHVEMAPTAVNTPFNGIAIATLVADDSVTLECSDKTTSADLLIIHGEFIINRIGP